VAIKEVLISFIEKQNVCQYLVRLCTFSGSIKGDLRGVENKLDRSVLINNRNTLLYYLILGKGTPSQEKHKTSFSIQLNKTIIK
jgi:hypothetical protein